MWKMHFCCSNVSLEIGATFPVDNSLQIRFSSHSICFMPFFILYSLITIFSLHSKTENNKLNRHYSVDVYFSFPLSLQQIFSHSFNTCSPLEKRSELIYVRCVYLDVSRTFITWIFTR